MPGLNFHDGLKTCLPHIFCRNPKQYRTFYRGNLRTYFSTILKPKFPAFVAMDQEFQEPAASLPHAEPILRIHGAQA